MSSDAEEFELRPLSPSSIELFSQCPLKWKFRYVDRISEPPGAPAVLGTFVHSVLEHLMLLGKGMRTIETAREIAGEVWKTEVETAEDFLSFGMSEEEIKKFKVHSWNKISGLWELEDPNEVTVIATEMKLSAEVEGVPFYGIVDRLDATPKGVRVSDYKSGKAPDPRWEDGKCEQLFYYAAALESLGEHHPESINLMYLGERSITRSVTKRRLGKSQINLRYTWQAINSSLESGEWPTRTGPLCAWCPYVAMCGDGQQEVERRLRTGKVRMDAPALQILGLVESDS